MPTHQLCLALMRWGEWPPWISATMRTLELNPSVRFLVLGDARPAVAVWPSNCEFYRQSVSDVLERVRARLGASPGQLGVSGSSSKISDFKPLLGDLYPDLLAGCDFWGYMQEDQLLGALPAFLDDATLSQYDTISPLPSPFFNAGPFMLYRNSKKVNGLYRLSSQLQRVAARSGES